MQLTNDQKRAMYKDGYVTVRGAVPKVMIEEARRAINHHLGSKGLPPDDLPRMSATSYCPGLGGEAVMTDLFNKTPLFALCESLVGPGNLLPTTGTQIALRFPGATADRKEPKGHLDGIGTGNNGIEKGEFRCGFTMLVTVLVGDVFAPYSGNFTVWPGSHRAAEAFFQTATPEVLRGGMPKLDLPHPPVQVTGEAGDAVISHHQLVHGAAPNAAPNIRYAAIFRARHIDAERNGIDVMTDIWREWPGIRGQNDRMEPAASLAA